MPPETMRKPSDESPAASACALRDDLLLILHELGCHGFEEAHRLGRHNVHQRAALRAREHRLVDACAVVLPRQNETGARAT